MEQQRHISVVILLLFLLNPPCPINGVGVDDLLNKKFSGAQQEKSEGNNNWCYDKPACDQTSAGWLDIKDCKSGARQSPINFEGVDSLSVESGRSPDFSQTKTDGYDLNEFTIVNSVKTIMVRPTSPDKWSEAKFHWPDKDNGGVGVYRLQSIHFHWGPDDNSGSEHKINGKGFAVEVHFVHYKSGGPNSYANIQDAINSNKGDALAVIGFLLQVDDASTAGRNDTFLDVLNKWLPAARQEAQVLPATPLMYTQFIKAQTHAYHYEGSLTTPSCNEIVQWIVLKDPLLVKSALVKRFRDLTSQQHTFRNVQDIKGRKIQKLEIIQRRQMLAK